MATRFVRVDLSDASRDYRPIAVEPGVPMLDKSNSHNKILFRWLGGLVAEPVLEGESVNFFARDDRGGRLEEIACQPVAADDLEGPMKADFAALRERIERVHPETSTERALHKCVLWWVRDLTENFYRTDLDSYFFKYRDASERWRLVWCWGYQRVDEEMAPALVCTDPECNMLFVRRPKQSPKCPSCEAMLATRPARHTKRNRRVLVGLLLLLLLALLGWWWMNRPRLTVSPENVNLVEGEIFDLKIDAPYPDRPITVESDQPGIVAVTKANRLVGHKEGSARIAVAQGSLKTTVNVTVEKGEVLSIAFDPARIIVPVDDTVAPRLMAQVETKDGQREAEMAPGRLKCEKQPSPRFAVLKPETLELAGISPTTPKSPQTLALRLGKHRASAPVEVVVPPLTLTLEPEGPIDLPAGQMRGLEAVAEYKSGRKAAIPSHLVKWHAVPGGKAAPGLELRGERIAALKPNAGPLSVYATYYGNESNRVVFNSVEAEPVALQLKSDKKEHQPGEAGEVKLTGMTSHGEVELVPDLASFKSSEAKVVAINGKSGAYRAIAPGEATVTATHATAKEPASLKFTVTKPKELLGDQPTVVKILSDQGPAVRFPVGAEFDDFRVVAEYADGFTRVVTKKASITTPEPPQSAPLAARNGRLVGVRPGQTQVHAEYNGVAAKQPLGAEVTAQVDVDRIQLTPSPLSMLRGETIAIGAVGYKNGKSVGIITGLGNLSWRSSNPQVAKVDGPAVTGVGLGQSSVTAQLGPLTSQPAAVSVVDAIAGGLTVEPKVVRMRVGESVRLGADLTVFRGDMELSAQCNVTPALPNVVRYVPETRSLVGIAPGVSAVAFTLGDKLANMLVEVLPGGGPIDGQVVIEPAAGNLAPGQALPLRVFVVTPGGARIDRTASAVFASSDPAKIRMMGDRACALSPGTSQITALLPGAKLAGMAYLTVNNDEITSLVADPPRLDMSTGDVARLRVLGAAPSGTYELFPQPDLKVSAGGANPDAISIAGAADIHAVKPGQASIAVRWRDKLNQDVPVSVADNVLTDLQITPIQSAIRPGQGQAYQVTALRGGQRCVLRPENGVQLFTGDQRVAQAVGSMVVRGNDIGRTPVVAKVAGQTAEAILDVVSGTGLAGTEVVDVGPGGVAIVGGGPGGTTTTVYDPNDPAWAAIVGGNETIVEGGPGVIIDGGPGGVYAAPAAPVTDLRFVPDVLRMAKDSPPMGVRVVEVLANGADGRDVTADPNLEITEPPQVVKVEKTATGPVFRPTGDGQTRVAAKLGDLLSRTPLLIAVGDVVGGSAGARLLVAPDPMALWSGDVATFGSVKLDPGGGQTPFEVDYKITPAADQGIVESAGEKTIRGRSAGATQVVVSAIDPTGVYDGVSTNATVQVTAADRLYIEPAQVSLQVGQPLPPLAVMAQGAEGPPYQVPATLESMDPNVLAPDPQLPGGFTAKALGGTQVRATYRGRDATATVEVNGQRFVGVTPTLNEGDQDFDVSVKVLAAESEGELQYRVYAAGQPPPENWVPAQQIGQMRQVELRSPRMAYGPRGTRYQLIIEARSPSGGPVQQYPLSFQLKSRIEETK
jgi:hypothetical protein